MKILLRFLVIISIAICPACLEIEEEISLNKDGSGKYRMTVDMNAMVEIMKGFLGEGEVDADAIGLGQMDSVMEVTATNLRAVEGLSNVHHKTENFTYSISYHFDKVETLNQVGSESSMMGDFGAMTDTESYAWTRKTFERKGLDMEDIMGDLEGDMGENLEMAKMMMADAKYRMIYNFPGKVKKVSNPNANISTDGKTVSLEIPFLEIMEGEAEVGNKIKFKSR